MLRHLRLRQPQQLDQVVDRPLSLGEGVENLPAPWFRNRIERVRGRRRSCHGCIICPYGNMSRVEDRAVTGGSAIEHGEVRTPGADVVAVAFGEYARGLRDVAEVVGHPGGEQLPQGDGTERGVLALERELGVREVPAAQRREVLLAEAGELVEELLQVLPCTVVRVREAVERLEAAVCVLGED